MLRRRIVRTHDIDPLRASTAREASLAAWDASPPQLRDWYARDQALRRTQHYLRRVLPDEGLALGPLLGSGEFGEVFALEGSDLVVKVTLDPHEAGFARFVQNFRRGSRSYPEVHAVYKTAMGTYLIFREALHPRAGLPFDEDTISAAERTLRARLRGDIDIRHLDLHPGNIMYRIRGRSLEAVVSDLGLTAYPTASVVAEVNPKRNPMSLYPKPSGDNAVSIIVAGFDRSLSGTAFRALQSELPDLAAELAETDASEWEELAYREPGAKRISLVVVPVLLEPKSKFDARTQRKRKFIPRRQIRDLLTSTVRGALDHYVAAANESGRDISIYVHALGSDLGADREDVTADIQDLLADYNPEVLRMVRTPGQRRDRLIDAIGDALEGGDRLTAAKLLRELKSSLYQAERSR